MNILKVILVIFLIHIFPNELQSQNINKHNLNFKVLGFYTGKNDMAHISYVNEVNRYFDSLSLAKNFNYK